MKKKWHLPFLLFLIVGTVVIWRQGHPAPAPYQEEEGSIFGTVYHVKYQSDSLLTEDIKATLKAVDMSLSMFNEGSTLARINRNETVQADSLLRIVFLQSQQISQATDGAFDITVGPLVNAWGFGFKHGELPDSARVDSLRSFVGHRLVSMDEAGRMHKTDERMVLDCSAVAKGFGVDCVAGLLRDRGVKNFMVEIGGEIVVSGVNAKGKPWSIGISVPSETDSDQTQSVMRITDAALATSGNYRNFYVTEDGRKLAHTIDPRTGYPVQHSVLSATVVAPTCAMADAFATAFMVLGIDGAQQVLEKHHELKAYLIHTDEDGQMNVWKSPNWQE